MKVSVSRTNDDAKALVISNPTDDWIRNYYGPIKMVGEDVTFYLQADEARALIDGLQQAVWNESNRSKQEQVDKDAELKKYREAAEYVAKQAAEQAGE